MRRLGTLSSWRQRASHRLHRAPPVASRAGAGGGVRRKRKSRGVRPSSVLTTTTKTSHFESLRAERSKGLGAALSFTATMSLSYVCGISFRVNKIQWLHTPKKQYYANTAATSDEMPSVSIWQICKHECIHFGIVLQPRAKQSAAGMTIPI